MSREVFSLRTKPQKSINFESNLYQGFFIDSMNLSKNLSTHRAIETIHDSRRKGQLIFAASTAVWMLVDLILLLGSLLT